MAIRYSGDCEVRVRYVPSIGYIGHVRAPDWKGSSSCKRTEVHSKNPGLTTPEAYDDAALLFLKWGEVQRGELPVELDKHGEIVLRRVFQAPCPTQTKTHTARKPG